MSLEKLKTSRVGGQWPVNAQSYVLVRASWECQRPELVQSWFARSEGGFAVLEAKRRGKPK